jgi:uncharacterized protein (TIGR03086 family)
MTEVADRYRTLAEGFTARVDAVPEDRWGDQAPCEGWTARDVVRHVVETQGMFLGFVGRKVEGGPSFDEDPAGAWATARDAVQAALDDPEVAEAGFEGHFGPTTLATSVDRFACPDLLLHGWDLARATGGDEQLDPDECGRVHAIYQGLGDSVRSNGVFGPELPAPPDADPQTRLLAFTGRQP